MQKLVLPSLSPWKKNSSRHITSWLIALALCIELFLREFLEFRSSHSHLGPLAIYSL